ncbi:Disease resistance protein RGA2 [Sesamum alatum]|uniref:Disease resistance protein RGA2 n=1 Tax=Sesamum alatum TaxID=300844 RepID=A0AAE1YBH7_9LAMI|nr:Disease resistance protein RGA2 [Sesamum alatum]
MVGTLHVHTFFLQLYTYAAFQWSPMEEKKPTGKMINIQSFIISNLLLNELHIYGRNEEKEMIMENMTDVVRDHDDLSIYVVWGMGGLGKTTLEQMIYNDERPERHFELRIWVCVSDDFSMQRLVKAIVESIDGVCNISELDPLQSCLQERLSGKRFLLVLDDAWNENHELWDILKEVLRYGSKGNVLLVTTQIEKVALMVATVGVHQIGYLLEDDSWSLFRQRAFTNGDAEENLVAIAMKVNGQQVRKVKSDSYHMMKMDYEMEKKQLIQLWMGNGFVPSQGQSDLNLTGHLIFKELVCISFLQDVKTNYMGEDNKGNKLEFAIDGSNLRSLVGPHGDPAAWNRTTSFSVLDQQYLRALHMPLRYKVGKRLKLICSEGLVELPRGQNTSHQIDQLKEFKLGRTLTIKGLANVSNMEDAKRANLMVKNNLTSLSLLWPHKIRNNSVDHYEEVLQGLQPHQNLENLYISHIKEVVYNPKQATLFGSLSFLTSLTSLNLFGFSELDVFPGEFPPNLEYLDIGLLPILRTLSNVLDGLSALRFLRLERCSNLESMCEELNNLNSLEILHVNECDVLRSFPSVILDDLPSLRSLSFRNRKKLKPLSGPLRRATTLRDLKLSWLPEMEHLPGSMQLFTALRELRIWSCQGPRDYAAYRTGWGVSSHCQHWRLKIVKI